MRHFGAVLTVLSVISAVNFVPTIEVKAQNPQFQQTAATLCSIAVGVFVTGEQSAGRVLGSAALQTASQQTGGVGTYDQLLPYGAANNVFVVNPHIDQDGVFGQLFHFFCTSHHQRGALNWEIKYAPATDKIEYFAWQFAQGAATQPQNPAPQIPAPQNTVPQTPQDPHNQTDAEPVEHRAPSKDEACKAFPGMC